MKRLLPLAFVLAVCACGRAGHRRAEAPKPARNPSAARPLVLKPLAPAAPRLETLQARACELESLPAPSPRSRRRHAVVAGGSDAALVRDYLTRRGFLAENVKFLGSAPSQPALRESLEAWLPARVLAKDEVFVYLAGRGEFDRFTGEPKLLVSDGAYPLRRAYAALARLPVKRVTVVLDSPAQGSWTPVAATEALRAPSKLRVVSPVSGAPASMACGGAGHGFVTYFWLKGMKGAGR